MPQYKILLVDDDPFVLQSIKHTLLHDDGYDVTTAASGEEAVALIGKNIYDLVLTDLVMESVDGMDVLKKAKESSPETIVIILTGFGNLMSAIEALRLQADDFLLKPCEPEELSFRISGCLEKLELQRKLKAYETILPVCCMCKSIRDDTGKEVGTGQWLTVEEYMLKKTNIVISPTFCPQCIKTEMDNIAMLKNDNNG